MKILVLSWRDPKHPLAGGAEQVMHEHMKGWVRNGFEVTLFASFFNGGKKEEIIDGIRVVRDGNQYIGVQLKGFLFYQKNKQDYDLIVDQFHGLPFFSPLFVKKPILAVVQETAREVWFLNHFPSPLKQLAGVLGYLLEPFFYRIYKDKQFMTGSNSARQEIMKFGIREQNITVIPHGVIIISKSNRREKKETVTITFLGILTEDKGILDALECFKIISDRLKEVQFWIIGKSENEIYQKVIDKKVREFKGDVRLKFWGFVEQEKKFELLGKSDVLVNPSSREGWGLVNIEANAMGVPVVAYKNVGLIDSVKDGFSGLICKENNPENMADEVIKLISDDVRYKEFSENAKKWSEQFSWIKSTKLSLFLIKKVCNES